MVKAYWLRIFLCGIIGLLLGFVIALVTPKQYDAVLQVLMPPPAPAITRADSSADQSIIDLISFSQPRNVNTQVETLTSLGIISTAARRAADQYGMPMSPGSELYPVDLQDKITVSAATQSDLVTLRVRASNDKLARDIAAYMYQAFDDESQKSATEFADRAIRSLETQIDKIDQSMKDIDRETEAARKEARAPNLDVQLQQDLALVRDLEQSVDLAKQEQASARAKVTSLQAEIVRFPDTSTGQQVTTNDPMYQAIERDLRNAEADREQLSQRYLDDSEVMQGIDRKISEYKSQLKSYKPKSEQSTVKQPNPNRLNLLQELSMARAQAASASDRVIAAESQLNQKMASMVNVPELQTKLIRLARQQSVQERLQATYRDRLASLKAAGVGRVNTSELITPAQASERPSVPNTNLNLSLGFVIGVAAGFLWALSTESRRNPIRSLGQLNRLALLPSYRAIPELRSPLPMPGKAPADVFDSLLANFVRSEKKGYRLGVLGVTRGSGASTTAANLAIAAARGGHKVLFVDTDPANSVMAKYLAGDAAKGVAENIAIQNFAPAEFPTGLPAEFEAMAAGKDLVLFDFAPVKVSGDSILFSNNLDEMVLLVRANVTKSVDFLQTQQALADSGCPLVTVSLSRVSEQPDDIVALEQTASIRPMPSDA